MILRNSKGTCEIKKPRRFDFGKFIVGSFDTGMMSKVSARDAVNMASRIETSNKDFGTQLLISQSAYEEIKGLVEPDKMYRARLKGKSGEHLLYAIKV
jgi:adenylate cyclase